MSGHRRVKNLDYDDDDIEDYDEEYGEEQYAATDNSDGMTPEDREQLRQGTLKVRAAMSEAHNFSDQQIQDALWHYWFDADKTIIYLKSMFHEHVIGT